MIQTRPTPFWNWWDSWWYWFICIHPKLSIDLSKGLNIKRAQGLTTNSWNLFYQNLTSLYTQHQYKPNHIWNCDEIRIQVGRQSRARVITKKGFHQVCIIIHKSRKWMAINCAVNVARGSTLGFYIFQGERIRTDYIMHFKPRTCMVVQAKHGKQVSYSKNFYHFWRGQS